MALAGDALSPEETVAAMARPVLEAVPRLVRPRLAEAIGRVTGLQVPPVAPSRLVDMVVEWVVAMPVEVPPVPPAVALVMAPVVVGHVVDAGLDRRLLPLTPA